MERTTAELARELELTIEERDMAVDLVGQLALEKGHLEKQLRILRGEVAVVGEVRIGV